MSKFTYEFIQSLPKAEVHCHLDGSMRVETILELAKEYNVELPKTTHDELKAYLEVGDECKDLVDYLKAFAVTVSVLQHKEAITRCVYELCEDAYKENVWALEIRYCPLLSLDKGLGTEEVIEAMLEGRNKAMKDFSMSVGIINCALRHFDPQSSVELAKVSVNYTHDGVVAFDLAGPEHNFPPKQHLEAFYVAMNNNLNITVHAGEAHGPQSIHQAIHYNGAQRIGHGTSLIQDEDLLDYVNDNRIALELCVNCNVQTKAVASVGEHPVKHFLDRGLRVCLNTDNRLISKTTLTHELYTVCDQFNLNNKELHRLILNGFKSLFIPYKVKGALVKKAKKVLDEKLLQAN